VADGSAGGQRLRILVIICFISTLVPAFAQEDLRAPTRLGWQLRTIRLAKDAASTREGSAQWLEQATDL
jgi:hypothetical protein